MPETNPPTAISYFTMFLPPELVVKATAHQPVALQVMLNINMLLLYAHFSWKSSPELTLTYFSAIEE